MKSYNAWAFVTDFFHLTLFFKKLINCWLCWVFIVVGFPGGSEVRASAWNAGDLGLIPGSGRSPGEGNGNPLQYSCLENPMEGGAWWAAVHGVTKSQIRLSDFTFTFHFHALEKEMSPHSSTLAWRIPWREEPGGLAVHGVARSQTWLRDFTFTFMLSLRCAAGFSLVTASRVYSSCSSRASICGGFSCWAWALGHSSFSSCGTWAQQLQLRAVEHRLSSDSWAYLLQGIWDLPRLGIKPMSPALARESLATELPREPQHNVFKIHPC